MDVQKPCLRGSGEIASAVVAGSQAPARVLGAPLGRHLKLIGERAPDLQACLQILLETLCNALLIGPDVNRLTNHTSARLNKVPAGSEQPIVFRGSIGH